MEALYPFETFLGFYRTTNPIRCNDCDSGIACGSKLTCGPQFALLSLTIMLAIRREKRLAKDITVTISCLPVSKDFFKDCRLLPLVVMGQFGHGSLVDTSEVREAIVRAGQ
jgi:hypothetical protein